MSHKRRAQDRLNQLAGGDKKTRRQRHLYLVLDDWEKGFSVHKVDADSFDSDDDDNDCHHHLPEPPALRVDRNTDMSLAAMGTKIFVLMNQRCGLVYDAETAALSIGAHAPAQMVCARGISVAVGDVLYTLMYRHFDRQHPQSFQAMSWGPCTVAPDDPRARRPHLLTDEGCWSWKTLPPPPFRSYVHSYALHPDGRTIFITSTDDKNPINHMGTYSFDTKDSAWRFHGNWVLPFHGQGHFDAELDAWVGLHRDGYICACQVISPTFVSTAPCFYPDCKMTKDKLFSMSNGRIRGSLTYMGDASKFCLIDCEAPSNNVENRPDFGDHDGRVINLTIFGLKYSHKGELQITQDRSTRSFLVSSHRPQFVPYAFWM